MSALQELSPMEYEQFKIAVVSPRGVELSGLLTLRDPASVVGPYFESLHEAVVADDLTEVVVDVSKLSFTS